MYVHVKRMKTEKAGAGAAAGAVAAFVAAVD